MRNFLHWAALAVLFALPGRLDAAEPVYIGLDAEFGLKSSTSAQAIEKGILTALDEINRAGGVLGGRPLELIKKDNRSVPARSMQNLRDLAEVPDLTAVFCGRFSPVVLETMQTIHDLKMIVLDPWASADGVTENGMDPNYVFRLSLKDRHAMPTMLKHAKSRGAERVGLLLPNTGWGRSNHAAANRFVAEGGGPIIVDTLWYNWGDTSLIDKYRSLKAVGAQAIVFVANDIEAAILVKELGRLPKAQRLPIISHWGVTGGAFVENAGSALFELDYSVVQTFNFLRADPDRTAKFMKTFERLYGKTEVTAINSPVGVGHAYDLTHILARAIDLAGTTDRASVRDALEKVRDYKGLIRDFPAPFTAERHDALEQEDVFMTKYRADGAIVPIQ